MKIKKKFANATINWVRRTIPNALSQTMPIITYEKALQLQSQGNGRSL